MRELFAPPRRQRVFIALGALASVAVAAGIILGAGLGGTSAGASQPAKSAGAATVQRRDLVQTDTEPGTLSYANPHTVFNRLSGTVTSLPSVGQTIAPGQTLYRVSGAPVILMTGGVPAYRDLSDGVSAGADVQELEQNLVALGFDPSRQITVDQTFDAATAAAVDRWQAALGETQTGTVSLGQVVFLPGSQRVTAIDTALGSTGGSSSGSGSSSTGSTSGTGASVTPAPPRPEFVSLTTTTTSTTTSTSTTTPAAGTPPGTPATKPTSGSGKPTTGTTVASLAALVALLKAEIAELKKSASSSAGARGKSGAAGASTGAGAGGASAGKSSGASAGSSAGGGGSSATGSAASGAASAASPSAQAIMQTTSTKLVVTVDLDATKQSEAVVGEPVTVQMPDGTTQDGKITAVSPVAVSSTSSSSSSSGSGGSSTPTATVPITITLHNSQHVNGLDQAAVSVNFEQQKARNVLSVPVSALLATAGGGYDIQEAAAPHRLIPVTPGLFAAGYVQVSGPQISPGLQVTDSQG